MIDIIISDFDNTLFKRNKGLLKEVVFYLQEQNKPIYIVTFRAENQRGFIQDTLDETNLSVIGLALAGSRYNEPETKVVMVKDIMTRYNVVEALDDDEQVVLRYRQLGINARLVHPPL